MMDDGRVHSDGLDRDHLPPMVDQFMVDITKFKFMNVQLKWHFPAWSPMKWWRRWWGGGGIGTVK